MKRPSYLKIGLSVLFILIQISVQAQKREYTTTKIEGEAPRIDGVIDEDAWGSVEWSGDFTQIEPYENKAPSQPTKFKLLYDDNNLYFAIRAYDSAPDSIVRRMSRRDEFDGDWVEVNIDSYHDSRTGFSFTINAAGVKGDEKITGDDNFDPSWNAIWYVKTSVDDKGWIAEMRIPLTQLRFGKQDEYVWGLQVNRRLFRKEERSSWQFISPQSTGWVSHFGEIYGISNIVPKRQKDLTPYVVAKMENYQGDAANPYATGREFDGSIGLDGKFGVTNDFTLDFTINPDFGQVEADPSEVNLSTFETFFPERRAFFIEGKDILSHSITPGGPMWRDNLFYSRRVGRRPGYWPELADNEYMKMPENTTILGAFKLSGKTKKGLSVGVMESMTQLEQAEISQKIENGNGPHYQERNETVEPFTNYFAVRVEQDLNDANTQIGGMLTAINRDLYTVELRDNMHSAAYTAGLNINHQWKDKTYYFNLNLVASQVQGTETVIHNTQTNSPHFFQRTDASHLNVDSTRTSLTGTGGTFQIGKGGNGKWRYMNWITYRSPEVNLNDMGYMRRNDEVQQIFWIQYRENEPKSFYRSYNINFNQWFATTLGPEFRYFGFNVNGHINYSNHWCTGLGSSREMRSFSTDALRGGPALINDGTTDFWGHVGTDGRKKVKVVVGGNGGVRDGLTAKSMSAFVAVNWQILDALKLSIEPEVSKSMDEIEFVNNAEYGEDIRYIRGKINRTETMLTLRVTWNISPDFTVQYYGMPFISAGNYTDYKYITDSKAERFSDRFTSYTANQFPNGTEGDVIDVNEQGDTGGEIDYSFDNPDFNVMDFNSNLVIRWEYKPGSTLFVVWTQKRYKDRIDGNYSFAQDTRDLYMNTYPHDVYLIKYSYRFGL